MFGCKNIELTSSHRVRTPSSVFLCPLIALPIANITSFSLSAVVVSVTKSPAAAVPPAGSTLELNLSKTASSAAHVTAANAGPHIDGMTDMVDLDNSVYYGNLSFITALAVTLDATVDFTS